MRVKIIKEKKHENLEKEVNRWLETERHEVIDIKYSPHFDGLVHQNVYSAMIIYR